VAVYHLSADIVRRSVGRTVTAAAAYRAGELIADQRTGLAFDYRRRAGVAHIEIMTPHGAPAWMRSRAALWNGVEAAEKRKDSQLAREIELGLPHELTPAQRLELVRSFVATAFVDPGMVADIAIHAPGRSRAEKRNHHAHVLLTMRAIDGDGFGAKVRAWNDTARLEAWRASWADHVNRALAAAGESARVDHRSLEAQGIDRLAQIQIGPAAIEMEARGITTGRGDMARKIAAINAVLAGSDSALAQWPAPAMMPAAVDPYQRDADQSPPTMQLPEFGEALERVIPTYRPPSENAPEVTATRPIVAPELETAKTPEHAAHDFGGRTAGRAAAIIKGLFREAKAMLRRADAAPQPKQRKRAGETEGDFRKLARKLARRFDVRQQFGKVAKARAVRLVRTIILSPEEWGAPDAHHNNAFDQLHQSNNDIAGDLFHDRGFDAGHNHISPGF
jgi:hypothetical protein